MPSSYSNGLNVASNVSASPETDAELVAAQTDDKVQVAHVAFHADAAMTVSFESGATLLYRMYVGANGSKEVTAPDGEYLFKTAKDVALTYTTVGAGNSFVSVLWNEGE